MRHHRASADEQSLVERCPIELPSAGRGTL
jgi:hypothetical protein